MGVVSSNISGAPFNGGAITGALIVSKALAPNTSDKPLDILDPNNADSELVLLRSVDGAGNEDVTVGLAGALDGTATLNLSDDNFAGSANITSAGTASLRPRAGNAASQHLLAAGNVNADAGVLTGGYLYMQGHTAPADAALVAGDCALWFDQTNGAAKLMVKAKTANGTVATAAIALA